jgi:hypothetical protein
MSEVNGYSKKAVFSIKQITESTIFEHVFIGTPLIYLSMGRISILVRYMRVVILKYRFLGSMF